MGNESRIETPVDVVRRLWPGGVQSRRADKDSTGLDHVMGNVRESALKAIREDRKQIRAALEAEAKKADDGIAFAESTGNAHLEATSKAEARTLRAFASKLGGA